MNFLRSVGSSPLIDRLGWTLLHSVWELSAIAVLLAIVRTAAFRRSPQARYATSCAALLISILAAGITFAMVRSPENPPSLAITLSVSDPTNAIVQPISAELSAITWKSASDSANSSLTIKVPFFARLTALLVPAVPWLALLWAVGALIMSIANLGGWIAVQRLRFIGTEPAPMAIAELAGQIARRLQISSAVELLQSAVADSPLVIGMFKPVILLPACLLTELSPDSLRSILAHELAHIRRHDYLVNLLQSVIETLLFYHPAIWWISRQIRVEREHCCDDLAISITQNRQSYARALAWIAGAKAPALAPAAASQALLPRLKRILGGPNADTDRSSRWLSGMIAIGLAILAAIFFQTQSKARGNDDPRATTTQPSDDVVTARGRVLDPDGKPVAGAHVSAVTGANWSNNYLWSQTTTDGNGEFAVSLHKSAFIGIPDFSWEGTAVVAAAPGFGPAAATFDRFVKEGTVSLKLAVDDVPIDGQILMADGKPAPGAEIHVSSIMDRLYRLDKMDSTGADPEMDSKPVTWIEGWAPGVEQTATSDGEGRFHLSGLGRDRTVELTVSGPGIAWDRIRVLTQPGPTLTRTIQNYMPEMITVYGAKFDYTATPGRAVSGTVRDAQTGKPMAGVCVETFRFARPASYYDPQGSIKVTTDADGRYRIDGLPKGIGNYLAAVPADDQPYFIHEILVPDAAGFGDVPMDIELHRGVWVSGRVTDLATGKPVAAHIMFHPWLDNLFARKLPEFHPRFVDHNGKTHTINAISDGADLHYTTHADGSFRIVGLPGKSIVIAGSEINYYRKGVGADQIQGPMLGDGFKTYGISVPRLYDAMKEVDIPEASQGISVDFQFDPGHTLRITTIDPDGAPLTGVTCVGLSATSYRPSTSATLNATGLGSDETRTLIFRNDDRRLGKVIQLTPEEIREGQIKIKLEPLCEISGRLVGSDGKPAGGVRLDAEPVPSHSVYMNSIYSATEADGRFHLALASGSEYALTTIKGYDPLEVTGRNRIATIPGKSVDLGDILIRSYQ